MLPRSLLGSSNPYYMDNQYMMMQNPYLQGGIPPQLAHLASTDYNHARPMITITPDVVIADEPIEAGCPGMLSSARRRRRSDSGSFTRLAIPMSVETPERPRTGPTPRNPHAAYSWETMTDEEQEEHHRMRRKEESYKTATCDAYRKNGACSYGDTCRFAHGENELRLPAQPRGKAHPKYKTQLCDKFSASGQCPYGPRCQFIHKVKKGLSLLEYESALRAGKISPSGEEYFAGDFHQSGRKGGRHDIPSKRRLSLDGPGSHGAYHMPGRNRSGAGIRVYPKMEVINIEKALMSADTLDDEENIDYDELENNRTDLKPISLNNLTHTRRPDSGLALDIRKSMEKLHLDSSDFESRFPRRKDLSLIREETEKSVLANERGDNTLKGCQGNKSCDSLISTRMGIIREEDSKNTTHESSGRLYCNDGSGATDAELLMQSYDDDDLIGQGLYAHRYPNSLVGMQK